MSSVLSNIDVERGDIVEFIDGTSKVVKKATDGHRVVFEDGSTVDLWIIEYRIKNIVRGNVEPYSSKETSSYFDFDLFEETKKSEERTYLATTYRELRSKLYHGGDGVEFYHITAVQNALSILNNDYFYSRESAEGNIKYDNAILNETSGSVMGSNHSYRTEKYARFYLNIKNAATYSFFKNYTQNKSFGVIFAVDFSAIWKSKTKVILSPINAHYLKDDDFDWSRFNIAFEQNLKNLDPSKFDLKSTYSVYDSSVDNPYLTAEILFYDKINLDIISHIYFKNNYEMNYFLEKLPYDKRKIFKDKCLVKESLFW